MPNLEALLASEHQPGGKKCLLGRQADDLVEPYLSAYLSLLEGDLGSYAVSYRLRDAGLRGNPTYVQNHRRGICGCPKEAKN